MSSAFVTIGGIKTHLEIPLPIEKVSAEFMLPLFHEFTNFVVDMSVISTEKDGKSISCQKGCGACCSQLVPIMELEINHLKRIVSEMPESQQKIINEKFKQATQQLATVNLLKKLRAPFKNLKKYQRTQLALDYFQLNIPCPFLENQSCTIHPQRPMACREYLVTSPVNHCSTPQLGEIEGIDIPSKVSDAVARLIKLKKKKPITTWFPIILIMESKQEKVSTQKLQSGAEWLNDLFSELS